MQKIWTWGYGEAMQRMMQKSVEKGGTCVKHGAMMKHAEEVVKYVYPLRECKQDHPLLGVLGS